MQGFLNIQWSIWKRTLLTRSIALIPAVTFAMIANNDLDIMNEWLNVQQSVRLPFALIPLLVFNCDQRVMGDFKLSGRSSIIYWLLALAILGVNIYLVIGFATGLPNTP
eukprot:UN05297